MVIQLHKAARDTERQLKEKRIPEAAIMVHLERKYPECFGGKAPEVKPDESTGADTESGG